MLTKAELEKRCHTIGSSDVPVICGYSNWKTRGDILKAKFIPESVDQNIPAFRGGHKLEKPIAELAVESGVLPVITLIPGWTIIREGWMSSTIDFYGLKTGNETYRRGRALKEKEALIIEVKNVGWRMLSHWNWGKGDKVPDYVAAQVQWQLGVLGHSKAVVVALLGGEAPPRVYEINRDEVWVAHLEKECRAFWEKHLASDKRDKIWARIHLEQLKAKVKKAA